MHPAPSLIFFTTLSGIGFGLFAWLGLGFPRVTGLAAFGYSALAFGLAGAGLLSSTFHLGHPERALKAFTQWRTSWLSREAWLAAATLSVFGIYCAALVFWETRIGWLGLAGTVLAVATVASTAMIYGQLKTVPRWNHWSTPTVFLALSAAGGSIPSGLTAWTGFLLVLAGVLLLVHWYVGDEQFRSRSGGLESATGLGGIGAVRSFEPPHTGTNYLLHEMVHIVGRKHARRLRQIAIAVAIGLPLLFLTFGASVWTASVMLAAHIGGVLVARWLFFAEAEHVVGLYYGAHSKQANGM